MRDVIKPGWSVTNHNCGGEGEVWLGQSVTNSIILPIVKSKHLLDCLKSLYPSFKLALYFTDINTYLYKPTIYKDILKI